MAHAMYLWNPHSDLAEKTKILPEDVCYGKASLIKTTLDYTKSNSIYSKERGGRERGRDDSESRGSWGRERGRERRSEKENSCIDVIHIKSFNMIK
tara:strand:+ start:236 stop:523 length:288 start_codon:yes stop_codon:yes gene_type:complete